MPQPLLTRIPEKHRFVFILVATSVMGVVLLLVAVYNASKELERLHEVDNLHRFATAQLRGRPADTADLRRLLGLGVHGYRVMIARDRQLFADSDAGDRPATSYSIPQLEATRINEHGGYLERDGRSVTWTSVPLADAGTQLFLLHDFTPSAVGALARVYAERLLVPAAFYIWLMVWMGCSLRFLTDKLSRQKKEMEHMALHDALSGLPNRNLLGDRLNKLVEVSKRRGNRFALAMIDLDGFKNINDSLGHDAGDTLLRVLAQRLSACMRSADTVARVGGDEFMLLLDGLDAHSGGEICRRAAAEIARPVPIRDTEASVGASIGVAVYPEHGEDAETLICNADQAMYAVKADGGGIRTYAPASESRQAERLRRSSASRSLPPIKTGDTPCSD